MYVMNNHKGTVYECAYNYLYPMTEPLFTYDFPAYIIIV